MQLQPRVFPGPAGGQAQGALAGGAGEPSWDVDQLRADGGGGRAGVNAEASAPAARVRLNAIVAQTSEALFAGNRPDGRCAKGPFFRSTMNCSMIACARCARSPTRRPPRSPTSRSRPGRRLSTSRGPVDRAPRERHEPGPSKRAVHRLPLPRGVHEQSAPMVEADPPLLSGIEHRVGVLDRSPRNHRGSSRSRRGAPGPGGP
jgi:hypothetical protein